MRSMFAFHAVELDLIGGGAVIGALPYPKAIPALETAIELDPNNYRLLDVPSGIH